MWDSGDLQYWYPNRRWESYITDTPTDAGRRRRIRCIWHCSRRWLGAEDPHGSNKPKNIQIGAELMEIWSNQFVQHVSIIYPSYMSRCGCSWACQILWILANVGLHKIIHRLLSMVIAHIYYWRIVLTSQRTSISAQKQGRYCIIKTIWSTCFKHIALISGWI